MSVQVLRRKFTADEYEQMVRAGILTEDDRVELIEGEIIEMSPIGDRHAACVNRLVTRLIKRLGDNVIVSGQNPVRLGDRSKPQPDVALLRYREDFFATGSPGIGDVLLVVEVADTSQEKDRNLKIPSYGRAGVAESWLVDLQADLIEVFTEPTAEGYRRSATFRPGDRIRPTAFPGVEFAVEDLLI